MAPPRASGSSITHFLLTNKDDRLEYVSQIRINDVSHHIYSFWKSLLHDTDELCRLIKNTRLTVASWDRQKRIFANQHNHNYVEVGFATFFLNRTNRSGILNGGPICGRDQSGPWKIDARYNADELIFRIESIAKMKSRIKLTHSDALAFLKFGLPKWPKNSLIYLDPPYYDRGRELYYDYYTPKDHAYPLSSRAACATASGWCRMTTPWRSKNFIRASEVWCTMSAIPAREQRIGKEVMFFSPKLQVSDLVGPVQQIGRIREAA